jgi:hypothetical protein
VAYDKRILEVMSDDASDEDYLTLNDTQIQNSVSCIYASGALPEEQVDLLRKHLWSKENPNCDVDGTRWRLKLAGIRREHHFSFVRLMPPLM